METVTDVFFRSRELLAPGSILQIGQRVYTGLHGGRYGIVHRIHGEQSPATVRSIFGGVGTMGGRAEFDILFDSGYESVRLSESTLRGVQWEIYDSVATTDEILDAWQYVKETTAAKEQAEREASERRVAERIQHAADNPHLTKKTDKPNFSNGRLAAENIRKELKVAFPKIKFRVKSDHNSVDIYWTDGPTSDSVNAICRKYKAGHFDGMTDCYEYSRDNTFSQVFGSPEYVFCQRKDTVEGVRKAWELKGRNPADVADDWFRSPKSDFYREAWSNCDLTP